MERDDGCLVWLGLGFVAGLIAATVFWLGIAGAQPPEIVEIESVRAGHGEYVPNPETREFDWRWKDCEHCKPKGEAQ